MIGGMKTFQYFRANEMRTMVRLVLGAYELAQEPVLWKEHVLRGLCRLSDARVACCSLLRDVRPGGKWRVLSRVDEFSGGGRQARLLTMGGEGEWGEDPMWEMAGEKGEIVTQMRRNVVKDVAWYESAHVKELRRKAGVDDCIYSLFRLPEQSWAMGLVVHRAWGAKKFGERERVIVHAMHEELGALYDSFSKGQDSSLQELPIQYADFAVWQRQWLKDDLLFEQLSFWKEQLAELPAFINLRPEKPRPPVQSYRGAHQLFTLPPTEHQFPFRLSQRNHPEVPRILAYWRGHLVHA